MPDPVPVKVCAIFLSLLVAVSALGLELPAAPAEEPAAVSVSTVPGALAPVIITAPRPGGSEEKTIQELTVARAAGAAAMGSGIGLMTYVVFFGAAGPFGWAAALIFVGGMTALMAHRRLQGHDDFGPVGAPLPSATLPARKN